MNEIINIVNKDVICIDSKYDNDATHEDNFSTVVDVLVHNVISTSTTTISDDRATVGFGCIESLDGNIGHSPHVNIPDQSLHVPVTNLKIGFINVNSLLSKLAIPEFQDMIQEFDIFACAETKLDDFTSVKVE